ncbi:MAG: hypothetical protein OTI36_04360 [Beijerinckiaceae bacterium]|nr:hypothetical protein [Beijerinckiaceae bacterium]
MADVEVRLHISLEELADFFRLIESKYGIFFFGMTGQIGEPKTVDQVESFLKSKEPTRHMLIFNTDPEPFFSKGSAPSKESSAILLRRQAHIHTSYSEDEGLRLCNVSARTFDENELACWKNICKDLRKLSPLREVDIFSSYDGKIYPTSRHRITDGAKRLYDKGIKLYELFSELFYIIKS